MINQDNIDGRVQKAFLNKEKFLKKQNTEGKNYFDTSADLDLVNDNPLDQEFYRATFAKVSVAVPDIQKSKDENRIVRQPISISSYMNSADQNSILDSGDNFRKFMKNVDPLTFNQSARNKDGENRFRGHSGIKSIKAAQQEFYTYQYTIEWECPDPVYFEQVFEPAFLKLGAGISIEFGYGDNFAETQIPPITIEDMESYLTDKELTTQVDNEATKEDETDKRPETIRDRNLLAPGTYYCDIGQLTKFDYKLTEGGGYAGSLIVVSMGASPLLEEKEPADESDNNNDLRTSLDNLTEFDKVARDLSNTSADSLSEEERTKIFKNIIQSSTDIKTLLTSGVTFTAAIKNLDTVLNKYFEQNGVDIEEHKTDLHYTDKSTGSANDKRFLGVKQTDFISGEAPIIKQRFKDGALYFDFQIGTTFGLGEDSDESSGFNDEYEGNSKLRKRYFMSWGFFEDIILGSFFELKTDVSNSFQSEGTYIQRIRSVDKRRRLIPYTFGKTEEIIRSNQCIRSNFVYSLGLDKVMLPGKPHPLLMEPLTSLSDDDKSVIRAIYSAKQLRSLEVIRTIYQLFEDKYRPFNMNDNRGSIRDMVFPVELYQKHFENATSLRQSLRDFWSDVSSMYGGYWRFVVGQSAEDNVTIGVSDMRISPDEVEETTSKEILETERDEALRKINNCYEFSLYSENSIIKSFDLSLDISSEVATLARYGRLKGESKSKKTTSLSNLSIEAWNLLTTAPTLKDLEKQGISLEDYQKYKDLQPEVIKNISYPSDKGKSRNYVDGDYMEDAVRTRGVDGFTWDSIPEIQEDTEQELEKINNDFSSLYKGVGIYNKDGNMSNYFKQTMLYLLTGAKIKGSGSLITTHPILMPLTITMSLDGIGGLKVGDIFKVDYLPKPYRKHTYFVISKVDHSVAQSGWSTDIEAYMQMIPQSYFKEFPDKALSAQEADLQRLFQIEKIDISDVAVSVGDTDDTKLNDLLDGIQSTIEQINTQIDYLQDEKALEKGRGALTLDSKRALEIRYLNGIIQNLFTRRFEVQKLIDGIKPFQETYDSMNDTVDNALIKANDFRNNYIDEYNLLEVSSYNLKNLSASGATSYYRRDSRKYAANSK